MPTATGKLQLADFDQALVARGFSAFQPTERQQMINLGYRYVARSFPWSWESTSQVYPISPGMFEFPVGTGLPAGVGSIEGIDIVTDPYRSKLIPETEQRFEKRWRYMDLTAAAIRGTPGKYYYYQGNIYILPPPQLAISIKVYYRQYLPDMVNPTDVTVLPQAYDELVQDAALVRCHRRAHEIPCGDAQSLDDAIFAALQDDVWEMEELQERTLPDDQWY
jgi:hypothetical protein